MPTKNRYRQGQTLAAEGDGLAEQVAEGLAGNARAFLHHVEIHHLRRVRRLPIGPVPQLCRRRRDPLSGELTTPMRSAVRARSTGSPSRRRPSSSWTAAMGWWTRRFALRVAISTATRPLLVGGRERFPDEPQELGSVRAARKSRLVPGSAAGQCKRYRRHGHELGSGWEAGVVCPSPRGGRSSPRRPAEAGMETRPTALRSLTKL